MKWLNGKGKFILVRVLVLAVVAAGGYVWLRSGVEPSDPATTVATVHEIGDELAAGGADVSLSISVEVPTGLGDPLQEFEGEGTVDFAAGRASLTYDFGDLVNAAGGFGHLDAFDVMFDAGTVYIEIFTRGRPWVALEPAQIVDVDVERLREVVLASPLTLPGYLQALEDAATREQGDATVVEGSVDPGQVADSESGSAFEVLSSHLEIDRIPVTVVVAEGSARRVDYELSFPVAEGAVDEYVVEVSAEMTPGEPGGVADPPEPGEVRDLSSFFDS